MLSLHQFFNEKFQAQSLAQLEEWIERGKPLAKLVNIDLEKERGLYEKGLHYFNDKRLEDAERLFVFLTLLDCNKKGYWEALGACQYYLAKYKEAIDNYTVSALLDPRDLTVPLNISYCYEKLKERRKALSAIEWAKSLTSDKLLLAELSIIERRFKA